MLVESTEVVVEVVAVFDSSVVVSVGAVVSS